MSNKVTLQISMAPTDVRFIENTLPHQLRVLGGQVEQIQFTVDTHNSRTSHFSTDDHDGNLARLRRFLNDICLKFSNAEIVEVDYSPSSVSAVGRAFLGNDFVPKKAYSGSPIYAYLYGLFQCRHDYIFHSDSDMLYGGESQSWIAEAVKLLEIERDVLTCSPLPGPPTSNGALVSQTAASSDTKSFTHRFHGMSSRVFVIDRRRFSVEQYKIPLLRTNLRRVIQAFMNDTAPYEHLEDCLSSLMRTEGLSRVDFLGSGSGLWSLHPPYRSERFYAELPHIIERVESNNIPDGQRGDYDLNDSFIDWTDARRQKTLLRRTYRQIRAMATNTPDRIRRTWHKTADRI